MILDYFLPLGVDLLNNQINIPTPTRKIAIPTGLLQVKIFSIY
jgi:hypothetical protein